ncbi:MAG: LysM domain-containing protein [Candidatus Nanopelagicales bacterium]
MTGRYADCGTAHTDVPDGRGGLRQVAYLLPRPVPPARPTMIWHRVAADDRPDLITARYLGDPCAFWAVCDANRVLDPDELAAYEGALIAIPAPGV